MKTQAHNSLRASLILPCKNEADALPELIKKIPASLDVILVDNGSTDNTPQIAKKLGLRVIREIRHDNGIGYGYALQAGIKQAKEDIIICMDADGSYPLSAITNVLKTLEKKKLDFISCNRIAFPSITNISSIRVTGVLILNFFTFILFGYKIKDSLTGMWVFRRSAINKLSLIEGGWDFSLEIKLQAIMNKDVKFAEYAIDYNNRSLGESKQNLIVTGFQHLLFLFKTKLDSLKIPQFAFSK